MKKWIRLIVFLTIVWMLTGCVLVKLRDDVKVSQDSCLLTGEIISPASSASTAPVIVAAYAKVDGRVEIGDYALLTGPDQYEILVQKGAYEIFAFEDKNKNLICDPDESFGFYGKPDKVVSPPAGIAYGLDVLLNKSGKQETAAVSQALLAYAEGKRKLPTSAGAIVSLENPAFSAQAGEEGFWTPLEFFKRAGSNIFFLEPYDPGKIPILFVHGAAGSPQNWQYMISRLDRTRYQPWVFCYPSGTRLQTTSFLLRKKIADLQAKYNFERLYIVAHSMGGLVSRPALIEDDGFAQNIKLYLSISTPWGGEARAKTGVSESPASDYIQYVFSRKIPPSIPYYLFFGHKGNGSLFRPNNDNTVTLESVLDARAQADALKVIGFDEDHMSILSSPQVMDQFTTLMARTEANGDKTYSRSKGYVHVHHGFDPPTVQPPSQMALVLAPAGTNEKETQLKIDPFKPDQQTGGIHPKKYDVSLCAFGFKTEPDSIPLEVTAGKIVDVSFTLSPQAMVGGILAMDTALEDSSWGLYKNLPDSIKISAIRLKGPGVSRTLIPNNRMSDREVLATFLASRDYAFKNSFVFFGMPEGTYDVTVDAESCEPFSTRIEAKPGEFIPPAPFRLILKK